jgi:hypothetical protein
MLKQFESNPQRVSVIKIHETCADKNAICKISVGFDFGLKLHDIYYMPKDEEDLTPGLGKLTLPGQSIKGKFKPFIELTDDVKKHISENLDEMLKDVVVEVPKKKNSVLQNAAEGLLQGFAEANSTPEKVKHNVQVIKKVVRRK